MSIYQVRRLNIGKTKQLDELTHACGELYSQTVIFFWRTVRHKGIWLTCQQMQRIFTSDTLYSHTSDACVESFYSSMKSWRERRKTDSNAHPPRRRRWYFKIEYKSQAIKLENGELRLSNGRGNDPLIIEWHWEKPKTVVIHWTGTQYEAIATYRLEETECRPMGSEVAGIDLGEIHMAVSHDGEKTHILNGRFLRSKRQYRNKLLEHLNKKISRTKKGSRRRKKLVKSKQKQLRKLKNKWQYHRDGVGAINIRRKYLGSGPVVGDMAPPTGIRYSYPSRSSSQKRDEKFELGNRGETVMALA